MPTRRDRRVDIMRAAERLFTTRRYHEITLDDVVQHANVGKGTVYRYFHDKDDLFFQTAVHGFDELCELLGRNVASEAPFRDQLAGACRQIAEFFLHRRPLLRLMVAEEFRAGRERAEPCARWQEHRQRLAAALARVLGRGVQEGALRDDVTSEVLSAVLLGMLRTHARDLADTLGPQQGLELVVDLFLRGSQAAPVLAAVEAGGGK